MLEPVAQELWAKAELPEGCRFFNLYGRGLSTPYDVTYGSWWRPVQVRLPWRRGMWPLECGGWAQPLATHRRPWPGSVHCRLLLGHAWP